jgi:3',5'-cyclic AMP phosphodiesterase CpdA
MSLVIAHLSDLHVSRYGEHVTSLKTAGFRQKPVEDEDEGWEALESLDGWRIQRRTRKRWGGREAVLEVRLLDEAGYVQLRLKGTPEESSGLTQQLRGLVDERHRTAHDRLCRRLPSFEQIQALLDKDPTNTNLLFCRAAHRIREANPDWVVLTGDLTDDGIGYDLVLKAFAPFVDQGRLLAIPGNHDVYSSPPLVVPSRDKKPVKVKRGLWKEFARVLGLPEEGPWIRELPEGVVVVGLDSCTPAWTPLSASGEVPQPVLDGLEAMLPPDARCRIALLHHHVVNPPIQSVNRTPWQLGMRLRNAKEVYDTLVRLSFACVLNGHRHLGYRYHPAHAPLFVSAPSATLGCRTGAAPYFWRILVEGGEVASVKERPLV